MRWVIALFLSAGLSQSVRAAGLDCLSCHEDKGPATKASVHGSLTCSSCHSTIQAYPHTEKAKVRVDCGTCHEGTKTDVTASVHAHSGAQPCLNCHGNAHEILASSNPKSMTYAQNLPKTCGECHASKQGNSNEVYSKYIDSIHGYALTKTGLLVAASCSSCHGAHKILSSKDPNSRTNHAHVVETCGTCHAGPKAAYAKSIHGQMLEAGVDTAPVCSDCHTAHQIASMREVSSQMKTTATCGGCHKDEYSTYGDTFHAQVSALGYRETARCWDCHGSHDILPASEAASKISTANLTKTCGKCHAGANASFVEYDPHADSHNAKKYPLLHISAIFMNLLLAGVLGFFALHTILWFIRSRFGGGAAAHSRS
ncbi:MAG: cytochrome c3 family protein [Acidobacteriia bacterium]|nr:cytochrome c3 family protein [Terriglobia bacterium]